MEDIKHLSLPELQEMIEQLILDLPKNRRTKDYKAANNKLTLVKQIYNERANFKAYRV